MKKFKHLPSGIIVNEVIITGRSSGYGYRTEEGYDIPAWIVSGSDWEEVREKDWAVAEYQRIVANDLTSNYDYDKIKSVIRFRDGEVFTVGDSFQFNNLELPRKTYFISKLTMYSLGCAATTTEGIEYNLAYASKSKEPVTLFTTHDGVAVYNRHQKVYSFLTKNDYHTEEFIYGQGMVVKPCFKEGSPWKHFSTKEKRTEYILENKPCLSLADVYTVLIRESPLGQKVWEIADKKINK